MEQMFEECSDGSGSGEIERLSTEHSTHVVEEWKEISMIMASSKERKPLICEYVRDLFYVVNVCVGMRKYTIR